MAPDIVPPSALAVRQGGFFRWLADWVRLLFRARHASRTLGRRAHRDELRRIVVHGAITRRSPEEITEAVARAMFARALEHGGGEAELGLFGPRIFRREAHAFIVETLGDF